MDYLKTSNPKGPIIGLLKPFAEQTGANIFELVDEMFAKYTVDHPAYNDNLLHSAIMDYFKRKVIPHKIAVYEAGLQLAEQDWFIDICNSKEEFLRNLIRHDLSKFSANEAFGYALLNFKDPHLASKEGFERAWHHHKMNNPHHPEYWLNPNRSGILEIQKMPAIYMLEMIADWIGAGKTYDSSLEKWVPGNLHLFVFHADVLDLLRNILLKLGIKTHKSGNTLYTTIDTD